MDANAIRLQIDAAAQTVGWTCTTCGNASGTPLTAEDNLSWLPLSVLLAVTDHECRVPPYRAVPVPPTPRGPDTEMIEFVARRLVPDSTSAIPLDDLVEAFGSDEFRSRFARRLRASLPPGTAVRREMINGVRANRLIGMRLR